MARIAGVELPVNKRIEVALTYIYGIGAALSGEILKAAGVDPGTRVKNLTEGEVTKLRNNIEKNLKVEGELRRDVSQSIRRLIEIGSYRGMRHRKGLPVRGQRTHTNSRTRKGPRRTIGNMKRKEAPAAGGGAGK